MKITFLFHCFVVLHFQCIHHFFSLQVVVASNSINKSDWTSKEIQTSPLRPNRSDQCEMRGRNSIFLGSNCLETWTKNWTNFKSTNLLLKTHFLCCKVIFFIYWCRKLSFFTPTLNRSRRPISTWKCGVNFFYNDLFERIQLHQYQTQSMA